jgi:hypothetical protein
MTRYLRAVLLAIALLCMCQLTHAQGGNLGSNSSPASNNLGRPLPGIDVSICQPLATTAASVTSNLAVLTMASNPITAGFAPGMPIMVAGFSGGDTYFNGGSIVNGQIVPGYTVLSVTSTTITYLLVHAIANASSNGTVLQEGNATTPCGGLATITSDPALMTPVTQPLVTDALGGWNAFAAPGVYFAQFYGAGVTTVLKQYAVACVPGSSAPLCGAIQVDGPTQLSGVGKFDGNCILDGVQNATLAAAITCAGSSGVIEIPMFAAPSFTTATIPVGVTLRFDGPSCLNNSGTLTINGPIVAPPVQIFCGSGTVALGPLPSSNMNVLWWWSGGEIGQALLAAYTSASSSGGFAWVPVAPGGGCYTWTTTLPLTTVGKYITYQGTSPPGQLNTTTITGTCLNWTSTSSGQAVTIDWAPGMGLGGGAAPGAGFREMTVTNALCSTNYGCSSNANGIVFGSTNGGGQQAFFQNLRVEGFLNPWLVNGSGVTWGTKCINCSFLFNTNGPNFAGATENASFIGSTSELNGTNLVLGNGAEVSWDGGSIDSGSVCGVSMAGTAVLHTKGAHWENNGSTNSHMICSVTNAPTKWFPNGDFHLDDNSTGSGDYTFHAGEMQGSIDIFSGGKTFSSFFTADSYTNLDVDNGSPSVLTGTLGLGMARTVSSAVPGGTEQLGSHLGTNSSGTQPTCVFTSGGGTSPTCIVDNGGSDSIGTIQLGVGTGSPSASGSVTLTFGAPFVSQHSVVRCQWQLSQNLAGQWNARATIFDKTTAVGSSLANWDNNAVSLSASTSYELTYRCMSQ